MMLYANIQPPSPVRKWKTVFWVPISRQLPALRQPSSWEPDGPCCLINQIAAATLANDLPIQKTERQDNAARCQDFEQQRGRQMQAKYDSLREGLMRIACGILVCILFVEVLALVLPGQ